MPDRRAFETQLSFILKNWDVVSTPEALDLIHARSKRRHAVWITFDDGDPTVVANALPALAAAGVEATLFICPGLIEDGAPPWWITVRDALDAGWRPQKSLSITDLKTAPHQVLKRHEHEAMSFLGTHRTPWLDARTLEMWVQAGMRLGNHSWSHPSLHRLTPTEQSAEIELADTWLRTNTVDFIPVFAYPSGFATPEAQAKLTQLGYHASLLHDHRLARRGAGPQSVSRLRLDAGVDRRRTRAVLSGAHGAAYAGARNGLHIGP